MDPYCTLIQEATVPDDVKLAAPKQGVAGSMPMKLPHLLPQLLARHDWLVLFRADDDGPLLPLDTRGHSTRRHEPGGTQRRHGRKHAHQHP